MVAWRRETVGVVGFAAWSLPALVTFCDTGVESVLGAVLFVTGSVVGGIALGIWSHQRSLVTDWNDMAVTSPLADVVIHAVLWFAWPAFFSDWVSPRSRSAHTR